MISFDECLRRLRDGDRIMITHPRPDIASDKIAYGFVDCGKNIGARNFAKLNAPREPEGEPWIEPVQDGLFAEADSQTFRLRQ